MTGEEMRSLTDNIAKGLADGWTRKQEEDNWDSSVRSHLTHPTHGDLYLSNSWAGKGRLHISGSLPMNNIRDYLFAFAILAQFAGHTWRAYQRNILENDQQTWDACLYPAKEMR